MKLIDALSGHSLEQLERLAGDKTSETSAIRLPEQVLVKEIVAALGSRAYVGQLLGPTRPPTFAILKLLLDSPDGTAPIDGFRERVLSLTERWTAMAADPRTLPKGKSYDLYLRILGAAWETDGAVDRSEIILLAALRRELGIWTREHLLLEHHPLVRPMWDSPKAYEHARNHLLGTGIVLVRDDNFVIADEVAEQVRQCWEMDIEDGEYVRLLARLGQRQLRGICDASGLPTSGSKEEQVERIVNGLIPPTRALDALHIDELKELCRALGISVSQPKAALAEAIVAYFDKNLDQVQPTAAEVLPAVEVPNEPRELESGQFAALLGGLTTDQLYDLLSARRLKVGGAKAERVARLVESGWSENTILGSLPKSALADLCRTQRLQVSGVKEDLVRRLMDNARHPETADLIVDIALGIDRAPLGGAPLDGDQSDQIDDEEDEPTQPTTRVPDPPGLRDVRVEYPDVLPDAQIVLAVLRNVRSLTDRELERVVRRHQLGWFLVKAEMAELLAQLDFAGTNPIRVRCSGGVNIYEWVGAPTGGRRVVGLDAARDLIDALRQGVVPDTSLDELVVGQDAARAHLVGLLGRVAEGRAEFKFIRGAYGSGKTFMCSWLRERALSEGFAVSTVRVGPDQPLSDLPVFYSGLCDGLRTPGQREASAVADILESWLLGVYRKTAALERLDLRDPVQRARAAVLVASRIESELEAVSRHDPSFAPAVRHFYLGRLNDDEVTVRTALSWLRGSASLSADQLRRIGVRGQLQAEDVFPRTRGLLALVRGSSLRGLVLFVDELELVRRFPQARQRERAYETLRLLVDECGENGLPGCLIVCTGTDPLFEDQRFGMPSYEALMNRIGRPSASEGMVSVRQPIITLEPLDAERILAVARRVRGLHGAAYSWDAEQRFGDELVSRFVDDLVAFAPGSGGRVPRPVLRQLVHVLDLCEENPDVPASDFIKPRSIANLNSEIAGVLGLGG